MPKGGRSSFRTYPPRPCPRLKRPTACRASASMLRPRRRSTLRTLSVPKPPMQYRAPTPTRGRSCFTPRARPLAPKACPGVTAPERIAAVAHVAQNLYRHGECTLGVMPLYHTMGVRSLLAMSLIGGTFVCLPQFDVERALRLIAAERVSNLYLVPTLYHDLVNHPHFAGTDVASVRKLGFAGAPMTDALLQKLQAAFRP